MNYTGDELELIGIIPAAGYGSRLYPFIGAKETLPIGSQDIFLNGKIYTRPKIIGEYIIEQMVAAGVKKIFIITRANKQDLLKQYTDGSKYGVSIAYIIGEPQSMVHSIDLAYEWVKSARVVMGMPDTVALPLKGLRHLLDKHGRGCSEISLGLYQTDNSSKFGMITVGEDDIVIGHEDKPTQTDTTNMWGIAVWEPKFTERLHIFTQAHETNKEIVFGDLIEESLKNKGACKAFRIPDGQYYDIGTYEEYKKAIEEL